MAQSTTDDENHTRGEDGFKSSSQAKPDKLSAHKTNFFSRLLRNADRTCRSDFAVIIECSTRKQIPRGSDHGHKCLCQAYQVAKSC